MDCQVLSVDPLGPFFQLKYGFSIPIRSCIEILMGIAQGPHNAHDLHGNNHCTQSVLAIHPSISNESWPHTLPGWPTPTSHPSSGPSPIYCAAISGNPNTEKSSSRSPSCADLTACWSQPRLRSWQKRHPESKPV